MPLPKCIRIPADDESGRAYLLADGWREVEVLETLEGPAPSLPHPPAEMRLFDALGSDDDIAECAELAAGAFSFDRLHADPQVSRTAADEAKRAWVRNVRADPKAQLFGVRLDGALAGFLIWKPVEIGDRRLLLIDLLAVKESARRLGLGRMLIAHAAAWSGFGTLRAGTQAANLPAKAFYESLGMKVVDRQRTFHR